MPLDLSAKDIERGKFVFDLYDFEGNKTIDAYDIGNVLRALDLVPTQKTIEKVVGVIKKKGEKKLKVEEFLPMFAQVLNDKDVGNYNDFCECLRLYDKQGDGNMVHDELKHILISLGEGMDTDQVMEILNDCAAPPDDDGFTNHKLFIDNLLKGPTDNTKMKKLLELQATAQL